MQKFNAQTISVQSTASRINVSNPSATAFMQVWAYSLGSNAACNIAFQDGYGGSLGGYQTVAVGTPITVVQNASDPVFTVSPNTNLVISNPNTQNLGGWIRMSN